MKMLIFSAICSLAVGFSAHAYNHQENLATPQASVVVPMSCLKQVDVQAVAIDSTCLSANVEKSSQLAMAGETQAECLRRCKFIIDPTDSFRCASNCFGGK